LHPRPEGLILEAVESQNVRGNTMTIEVRNVQHKDRGYGSGNVYVSSPLIEAVSDFYSEHRVFAMRTKSKVWTVIGRKLSRMINAKLKDEFGCAHVMFSHKAGCSCGCSPGWKTMRGSVNGTPLDGSNAWVTVTPTDEELTEFTKWVKAQGSDFLAEASTDANWANYPAPKPQEETLEETPEEVAA